MRERELSCRLVARLARRGLGRRPGLGMIGLVTRRAACLGEVVAAGTRNRNVPGDVRCPAVHRGDTRREGRARCVDVEDARVLQCRMRDIVTGIGVAALAATALGVLLVIEAGSRVLDLLVAPQAPLVRHDCGHLLREGGLLGEVRPQFAHSLGLVRDARRHARLDVTVDTTDTRVRSGTPCGVERRHLVTGGAAEGGLVGGECDAHRSERAREERDEHKTAGDRPVSRRPCSHACHRFLCAHTDTCKYRAPRR